MALPLLGLAFVNILLLSRSGSSGTLADPHTRWQGRLSYNCSWSPQSRTQLATTGLAVALQLPSNHHGVLVTAHAFGSSSSSIETCVGPAGFRIERCLGIPYASAGQGCMASVPLVHHVHARPVGLNTRQPLFQPPAASPAPGLNVPPLPAPAALAANPAPPLSRASRMLQPPSSQPATGSLESWTLDVQTRYASTLHTPMSASTLPLPSQPPAAPYIPHLQQHQQQQQERPQPYTHQHQQQEQPQTSTESQQHSPWGQPLPPEAGSAWPLSAVGQVITTWAVAGRRDVIQECTGALIGPGALLTAAHCVYNRTSGAWAHSLRFHPGRYHGLIDPETGEMGAVDPWGHDTWTSATITGAYRNSSHATQLGWDVALVRLSRPDLTLHTGWLGVAPACACSPQPERTCTSTSYPSSASNTGAASNHPRGPATSCHLETGPGHHTHAGVLTTAGYPSDLGEDGQGSRVETVCHLTSTPQAVSMRTESAASPSVPGRHTPPGCNHLSTIRSVHGALRPSNISHVFSDPLASNLGAARASIHHVSAQLPPNATSHPIPSNDTAYSGGATVGVSPRACGLAASQGCTITSSCHAGVGQSGSPMWISDASQARTHTSLHRHTTRGSNPSHGTPGNRWPEPDGNAGRQPYIAAVLSGTIRQGRLGESMPSESGAGRSTVGTCITPELLAALRHWMDAQHS